MNQLAVTQSTCTTPANSSSRAARRPFPPASQALLLASLAREHQASEKLEAQASSRGALCKVVLALSLASIVLTSAVLADMLGSVVPTIMVHVVR